MTLPFQGAKALMITGGLGAGALVGAWALRAFWLRVLAARRLENAFAGPEKESAKALRAFPVRYRSWAIAAGVFVGALLLGVVRVAPPYAFSAGLLVGVIGLVTESVVASRRKARIEEQLIYALEIIAGSLRAGNGLIPALRAAHSESREPLRSHLKFVLGQVMIGEDPLQAIQQLSVRVPLDTFRFFTVTLCVHWESGGTVADTLLGIAKVIRDRVELMRRVQAESVEVHASVVSITFVSYLLTYLLWRTDPANMTAFLRSTPGVYLCSIAICLQAVGIVWVAFISRFKY